MDVSLGNVKEIVEPRWAHFGRKKNVDTAHKVMELMKSDAFRSPDDNPMAR